MGDESNEAVVTAPLASPLRASVYVIGVNGAGQGIGPTRIPRDQVVRVMEEVRRNGYLPIAYVMTHVDPRPGDFLADPDLASAVPVAQADGHP